VPKTYNQREYVKALDSKEDCITVVMGPAGTGKTYLACEEGINQLNKVDKLIKTFEMYTCFICDTGHRP
jgi:phosphate starvation-inducible protein PhoH